MLRCYYYVQKKTVKCKQQRLNRCLCHLIDYYYELRKNGLWMKLCGTLALTGNYLEGLSEVYCLRYFQ